MDHNTINISYNGETYTYKLKINERKAVRNWLTIKLIPTGEKFTSSYKLINDDHATIVWNQLADHFYSSNGELMLNEDLMTVFKETISAYINEKNIAV